VAELQGRKTRQPITKITNGEEIINTDKGIADTLAKFFVGKINKLRESHPPIIDDQAVLQNLKNTREIEDFTTEDIIEALARFKPKMSSGIDDIPAKVVKHTAPALIQSYKALFNKILRDGIPLEWKIAKVIGLPKKPKSIDVTNFRPISNLCSLEKLFERCILNRLLLLNMDDLVGHHQHGFRPFHSTTTCLLDLQSHITEGLDKGLNNITYTLDLTAAFDMLRRDTFLKGHLGKLPDYILWILNDFLSQRKFFVVHNEKTSETMELEVGCVQGSVLGPVLFNMYLSDITQNLPNAQIYTYADDSYVNIQHRDLKLGLSNAQETLTNHICYLEEKGMVINHSKTELILFTKVKALREEKISLKAGNSTINSVDSIRALGVSIDKKLEWTTHINNISKKFSSLMSGLRIIANKLDRCQTLRVVTSQVFSILYYASPVWLTTELSCKNMRRVESMHFSALRLAIKDYKRSINRDNITRQTKRMTPTSWMKYSSASMAIKIIRDQLPNLLHRKIMGNAYQEARKPHQLYTYDSSHNKHGKKGFHNWINTIFKEIKFPWTGLHKPISNDLLRIRLKETFSVT